MVEDIARILKAFSDNSLFNQIKLTVGKFNVILNYIKLN